MDVHSIIQENHLKSINNIFTFEIKNYSNIKTKTLIGMRYNLYMITHI